MAPQPRGSASLGKEVAVGSGYKNPASTIIYSGCGTDYRLSSYQSQIKNREFRNPFELAQRGAILVTVRLNTSSRCSKSRKVPIQRSQTDPESCVPLQDRHPHRGESQETGS